MAFTELLDQGCQTHLARGPDRWKSFLKRATNHKTFSPRTPRMQRKKNFLFLMVAITKLFCNTEKLIIHMTSNIMELFRTWFLKWSQRPDYIHWGPDYIPSRAGLPTLAGRIASPHIPIWLCSRAVHLTPLFLTLDVAFLTAFIRILWRHFYISIKMASR